MSHPLLAQRLVWRIGRGWLAVCVLGLNLPAQAEDLASPEAPASVLELPPELIESSPVLQRWLEEVPNVLEEIRQEPSFRTRVRLGYGQLDQADGGYIGVEDWFIGDTALTVSADYQNHAGRESYGADLQYYVLPLGSYVNLAPVVGYRHVELDGFSQDGLNLGVQVRVVPSRTSGADLTVSQTWVAPASDSRVSLTQIGLGYAVTQQLRLSTHVEWRNSPQLSDRVVGIGVEWMP